MKNMIKPLGLAIGLSCVNCMGYAEEGQTTENQSAQAIQITTYKTVISGTPDANQLFFSGKAEACAQAIDANTPNCCDDPTLSGCTDTEKTLFQAKQEGRAVYVGESCIKNTEGACTVPMGVYCVFTDVVSAKAQEGGRKQLNQNFGTGTEPDCSGLSRDEIKRIDFTAIDFGGSFSFISSAKIVETFAPQRNNIIADVRSWMNQINSNDFGGANPQVQTLHTSFPVNS